MKDPNRAGGAVEPADAAAPTAGTAAPALDADAVAGAHPDVCADVGAELDHVWFAKNPTRVHRLRDLVPFESREPLGAPPLGMTWRILVTRVPGGGRLRLPVPLAREVPNDAMDGAQLARLFDRLAPPDAVKICRHGTPPRH